MVQPQFKPQKVVVGRGLEYDFVSVPSEDPQGKKCGGFLNNLVFRGILLGVVLLSTVESFRETWEVISLLRNKEVDLGTNRKRKVLDAIFLILVDLLKIHTVCLLTYNYGILRRKIAKAVAALEEVGRDGGKSRVACAVFFGLMVVNIGLAVGGAVSEYGGMEETPLGGDGGKYLRIVMKVCSGFHLALIFDLVLVTTLKMLLLTKSCVAPMRIPQEEEVPSPEGKKEDDLGDKQVTFKKYRNLRAGFKETNEILDTTLVLLHSLNMLSFVYGVNYVTGYEAQPWTLMVPLGLTVGKSLVTYLLVGKIGNQNAVIGKWLRNWAMDGDGQRVQVDVEFWHIVVLLDEVRSDPLEFGKKGFFKVDTTSIIWVLAIAYFLSG